MSLGQIGNIAAIFNSTPQGSVDPLFKALLDSYIINFENTQIRNKAAKNRKGAKGDMERLNAAFKALRQMLEQLKNQRQFEPQIPEELPFA